MHKNSNRTAQVGLSSDVLELIDMNVGDIYDLACAASPVQRQKGPIHTIRTCSGGAEMVLVLSRITEPQRLQASTSEVNGYPQVYPQAESNNGNVNPIGSRACYNEEKRCAAALFVYYPHEYYVQTRVAWIFNVYSHGMGFDNVRIDSSFLG